MTADVPKGVKEDKVKLTDGAKEMKEFVDLPAMKKRKLLSKNLGGRVHELF